MHIDGLVVLLGVLILGIAWLGWLCAQRFGANAAAAFGCGALCGMILATGIYQQVGLAWYPAYATLFKVMDGYLFRVALSLFTAWMAAVVLYTYLQRPQAKLPWFWRRIQQRLTKG